MENDFCFSLVAVITHYQWSLPGRKNLGQAKFLTQNESQLRQKALSRYCVNSQRCQSVILWRMVSTFVSLINTYMNLIHNSELYHRVYSSVYHYWGFGSVLEIAF